MNAESSSSWYCNCVSVGMGPQASGGATSSAGAADTGNANGCKASIVATKSASHFFTFLTLSHSFLLNV